MCKGSGHTSIRSSHRRKIVLNGQPDAPAALRQTKVGTVPVE